MTSNPPNQTKGFDIPEILKRPDIGIREITLTQRIMTIKYFVSDDMKGEIKLVITGTWETDVNQLRNKVARKGFSEENIESLVKGFGLVYSGEAADIIAAIKHGMDRIEEASKIAETIDSDSERKPKVVKHFIQKYHSASEGNELYEAVLIGKDAYFVCLNRDSETPRARFVNSFTIPNAIGNTVIEIVPRENMTYLSKPYQFESKKEVDEYLLKASRLTLDDIYRHVKKVDRKYIAASDTHHIVLAADTVFTYFQDNFGQTHYLFFYGDNGTGKTINLLLLSQTGYRVMYDIDVTAANIYTYYGTVEEGQGCICEDEADDLDYHQEEKMKLYKKGYNAGGKVSRTDTGGDSGRKQEGYYVYGFKAFTGEERLDPDYAKGFNERTFYLECQAGDPEYDLSEVVSPAGAEEFEYLLQELEDMYKTLLAFRLLHHTDKFPNLEVTVKNREKQLVKPLIRLFQGTESLTEISAALGELLKERRGIKKNTLESAVYRVLTRLVEEQIGYWKTLIGMGRTVDNEGRKFDLESKTFEFTAKQIYAQTKSELDGTYKDEEKDQSFETPEHGKVSHKRISSICLDRFGATRKHDRKQNMLIFSKERLDKVKEAYISDDKPVQIIPLQQTANALVKDVKDSSSVRAASKNNLARTDDEKQTETEESTEEIEEEEEETEEFEEEEEDENV
jgi:hypothetical protein